MTLLRLKVLRESGKKKLFLIPLMITFANACLGLLSVLYALDERFLAAAYCIIAAAVLDGIDGKLARAFRSSSMLGMELDSLCDAVSFCFAPAIILFSWKLYTINTIGLIAVGFYLCAGLYRLAKFNMMAVDQKTFFRGLPTTIAACWVAGLVIASVWLSTSHWKFILNPYNLSLLMMVLAVLMISRLPFPSFKSRQFLSSKVIVIPILVLLAGIYALVAHAPFFLTTISTYILSSVVYGVIVLARRF